MAAGFDCSGASRKRHAGQLFRPCIGFRRRPLGALGRHRRRRAYAGPERCIVFTFRIPWQRRFCQQSIVRHAPSVWWAHRKIARRQARMSKQRSADRPDELLAQADALVLFGMTGDLAYKKIFPALYFMAQQGRLNVPIVGVASSSLNRTQLRKRIRESVGEVNRRIDKQALDHLISNVSYIDGDYRASETFDKLRQALRGAERPAHYLAI